jgi:diadenosine tetraphosphatase ApaH/serine/threonine PP2A family protein phosphatase
VLFVNCGSVGKPKDGDPRAGFAVLASNGDAVDVEIQRVGYPARVVAEEMGRVGLPEELAGKLVSAV